MSYIWCLLLIQITWISKTVALYHEKSMVEFQPNENLPLDAMFGYSITYIPRDETLIVSAPKANSIGEVYNCNINSRNCTTVQHNIRAGQSHDLWLGATVKAGSDYFVTCAPRYIEKWRGKIGTYSVCFSAQNGTLKKLESLSNDDKEFNTLIERYMDTFGWSIDISEKDHILLGGPAADKGRVIQYQDNSAGKAPEYIKIGRKNAKFNFGYSVAYCKLKSVEDIAIGSPYGKIGRGAVYLSSSNTPLIENEKDLPVGSLFAASMCSANLDGTSKSTLLVGAPTYASDDTSRNIYNRGAVFIYLPPTFGKTTMVLQATVHGQKDGGYFGSAIAKLGDLNGDRRDEIAISAPYEDDGRGAVYIYSGAELIKKKDDKTYLQRIQRENYRSFGLSLTALKDFDKNGCNELAIGIPGNNRAVLLKCMAEIKATVSELQPITGAKVPGKFGFESCVYIRYPKLPIDVHADIKIKIGLLHMHAKFAPKADGMEAYDIRIRPGHKQNKYCHNTTVLTPSNSSFDPTLQYHITAELLDDPRNRFDFDPLRVILSNSSTAFKAGTVWIGDCKSKQNCTPILDLEVKNSFQSPYVVGSSNVETLDIFAHNSGDTAYGAVAKVNITGVLASKWPKFCTRDSDEELTCKYQALLRNGTTWETGNIELETKNLHSDATSPKTKINMAVKLYDEFTMNSKVQRFSHWNKVISLISSSENVSVKGTTKNGDIVNVTEVEALTTGAHIDHVYSIINNGKTTWENANATISLRKEVFLSDGVNVRSSDNYACIESPTLNNAKELESKAVCQLKVIEKENKFDIIISIELLPGELESIIRKGNATVFSKLQFELNGDVKTGSITSTLVLYEVLVPIWIIILAALVALLLLVILVFAMYECGFLRRKNKERLKELKRDVRRQTMRQSMMVKHGPAGDQDDLQRLIDNAEKDEPTNNAKNKAEIVPEATEAEVSPQPCQNSDVPKPKLQTVHENVCGEDDKTVDKKEMNDTVRNIQPIKALKRDPRMDLIIGGIKENVRERQLEGSSSKT